MKNLHFIKYTREKPSPREALAAREERFRNIFLFSWGVMVAVIAYIGR